MVPARKEHQMSEQVEMVPVVAPIEEVRRLTAEELEHRWRHFGCAIGTANREDFRVAAKPDWAWHDWSI
jgi:hypothetical protein